MSATTDRFDENFCTQVTQCKDLGVVLTGSLCPAEHICEITVRPLRPTGEQTAF